MNALRIIDYYYLLISIVEARIHEYDFNKKLCGST